MPGLPILRVVARGRASGAILCSFKPEPPRQGVGTIMIISMQRGRLRAWMLRAAQAAGLALAAGACAAQAPQIGVYYYSGWKSGQVGNPYQQPWNAIKPYGDRQPMLGYYAEDGAGVMASQLNWMRGAGIDYVVFGHFWGADGRAYLDHGIRAYTRLSTSNAVRFALMWPNHSNAMLTQANLAKMFATIATTYMRRADYVRIDGKPMLVIFSAPKFAENARALGMTSAQLVALADGEARKVGLPGMALVGGMWGGDSTFDYSSRSGFAAWTAYNYHGPVEPYGPDGRIVSRSYAELDRGYRSQWAWLLANTSQPLLMPMTSGWDRRPWGGSTDPLHDLSRSTPAEFLAHLRAARTVMAQNPVRTRFGGIVCCWNEYGEGSFIEPTKAGGTRHIDQVRASFAP